MKKKFAIDLNCDMGEGGDHDAEIMPYITSANIACGAHAGDAETMRATVRLAKQHGVNVGAHPGFPDRANFGRKEINLPPAAITRLVIDQVNALRAICFEEGVKMTHVKPHGALYNMAARDAQIADAIAAAVATVDKSLVIYGLAGGKLLEAAARHGLKSASEVFADRTYQADGSLTPRDRADAMPADTNAAVTHAMRLLRDGVIVATNGSELLTKANTLCIHADGQDAVLIARKLNRCANRWFQ
jgi:UPF0271 protein